MTLHSVGGARRPRRHQYVFWATEGFSPAPDCFEVIANSILWDPFGMQWGCDGHWPLLLACGTKRYRSEGMQQQRGEQCRSQSRKKKTQKHRLARRRRRPCCAGGRRTTGGTGHRRCFRQRRRAAISSSECAGGPPVESGELGRPHSVSRGLMQYMHLMSAHSGLLTHAADAPRRKTKKTHCVSIS